MDNNIVLLVLLIAGPITLYLSMRLIGSRSNLDKVAIRRQWAKVRRLVGNKEPQFAVIEGDKVFDNALKQLGFKGETMGDRLKSAQPSIKNINEVWSAHKLRNRLVHEPDVEISMRDVQTALSSFEKALRQMGAL